MSQSNIEIKSNNYDNNGVFTPQQKKPHNYKYLATLHIIDFNFATGYPRVTYHHWNKENGVLVHKKEHEKDYPERRNLNGICEYYVYIKVNQLTENELNRVLNGIDGYLDIYENEPNYDLCDRLIEVNEPIGQLFRRIVRGEL